MNHNGCDVRLAYGTRVHIAIRLLRVLRVVVPSRSAEGMVGFKTYNACSTSFVLHTYHRMTVVPAPL